LEGTASQSASVSCFYRLLDHLVGGSQQCVRDGEAERLGGLEVITNSNVVDCTTGKSAGLAPLKMLPV
jgi:hypothetical protein